MILKSNSIGPLFQLIGQTFFSGDPSALYAMRKFWIIFFDLYARDRGNENVTGITLIFLSLENKGSNHTKGNNQGRGNDHFHIEGRSNCM